MLINLERIHDEPFHWEETLEIPPGGLDRSEVTGLSPVNLEGTISFTDPGYYLRARLTYEQELACDRCLRPVKESIDEPLELLVFTHPEGPEAEEQELEEKDLSIVHIDGDELDTEPLALEQVQLNVPMKPLCRPDCAGLCPSCGANLNDESCSCERDEVDPRWSALAALKGTLAGDEQDGENSDGD
ncbi:MAG: DUF177 domain-containing protein [Acidobacteriota bacterium]|nr:DUF177 domain-containing protein [Acidobacteriota bacterium]